MKKVFRIFSRDLKNIVKHPAAIIVVLGLCFILLCMHGLI